ncbi:MAG: hypothetical protein IJB74_09495 [Clostridia bacterium]|nr:hypothetical protein [Clostridia bacterium]
MTNTTLNPALPTLTHTLKSLLVFIITAFHLILPAQPENLEITVNHVTAETQSITFEIKNNTHRPIHKPDFSFEKKVNGEWKNADLIYFIPEDTYVLPPTGTVTESVHIENPESVTKGEYRLTVSYRVWSGMDSHSKHQKSVVFTVS